MLIIADVLLLALVLLGVYLAKLVNMLIDQLVTLIARTETLVELTDREVKLHDHARGLLRSGSGRDLLAQRLAARLKPPPTP